MPPNVWTAVQIQQGMSQALKIWSVGSLRVGDLKEDVEDISSRLEHVWTPIILVLGANHAYDVEEAFDQGRHYLRCVRAYQNYEFEEMFGFSRDCVDYVHHKIIVVKAHT